ncbi:hypothetical protein SAMN05421856_1213 [Chryseobacterium taichungense]|uniref:Uncharacterized protein n=2 Tax=Chryseobacterium taichungense TaxID=295069 RepID=A0A1H8DX75_9FLAO|nr:hypothetical protein SAMN05421856_1213 [Chryseobacterium taichungense]
MRETHRLYKILFYVFSCFVMLYSSSIKAQNKNEKILKKVTKYFGELEKEGIQACIHNEPEVAKAIKQGKYEKKYDIFMDGCNESVSHYGLFETDTKHLLTTLYNNKDSDFIIINMINPKDRSTLISKSTFTFSRKKNEKELYIINNHYEYNEEKKKYELIKDSSISNFNVEEKMKLIEDYLYYKKENSISDKSRNKPYSGSYYVVARINGKFLIKEVLDYSSEN